MPGISLERRIFADGRSCFESLTPRFFKLSSFSSSIITPAITRGPITGPRPASSTPQILMRLRSSVPNPVVNLTNQSSIDRFTILFRNLPVHTSAPRVLYFWIARSELHRGDHGFRSIQDFGDIIPEGRVGHFHRPDLVDNNQIRGTHHRTLQCRDPNLL